MSDQNLPVGPVDRRQATRGRLRGPRRQRPRLFDSSLAMGLLAVLLAAGGLFLVTLTPRVEVSVTENAYSIDGVTLAARGGGVYQGSAGVVVLRDQGATLDGAASATVQGRPMVAHCDGIVSGTERCTFRIGARGIRAVDTWRAGSWFRVYGDGRRVELAIRQRRPVPVPIPVDP